MYIHCYTLHTTETARRVELSTKLRPCMRQASSMLKAAILEAGVLVITMRRPLVLLVAAPTGFETLLMRFKAHVYI